jgi:hypothetical protein
MAMASVRAPANPASAKTSPAVFRIRARVAALSRCGAIVGFGFVRPGVRI